MPLFNAKFVAVDCCSTNPKITQAALLENGHSSAGDVMWVTFEMSRIEMPLFNAKFAAFDSSPRNIKFTQPALHENCHS